MTGTSGRAIRVLHVIESLGRGGAEQALVYLLPHMNRRGYACAVATLFSEPMDLRGELEERGVPVVSLALRHRWQLVRGTRDLGKAVRSGDYDIVHGHLFFGAWYTGLSRPAVRRAKRVTTFHNMAYDSYPATTPLKRIRKRIDALLLRTTMSGFVAVSDAAAAHYSDHLGIGPIETIPNGFALEELRVLATDPHEARRGLGIDPAAFLIVVPARLVPEKGHRFLLQALADLRSRGRCPTVLMLGHGPARAAILEERERLGLSGSVIVRPPLPHGELVPILASADLLVLPATHEGFGMAAAEAMAVGTPVIVTRIGGLKDLVEDGISGLLVPAADPTSLAAAIERVIIDPGLSRRLAAAARSRIETRYSIDAVAATLDAFYRRLLQSTESQMAQEY